MSPMTNSSNPNHLWPQPQSPLLKISSKILPPCLATRSLQPLTQCYAPFGEYDDKTKRRGKLRSTTVEVRQRRWPGGRSS
ncbi:unnamed protein product [Linum trigynum]|uniref:Uncharacterized protein n=1 Tax=Linum trigynum TaxID=586398 RepID=A0AAV2EAK1_9ROSI